MTPGHAMPGDHLAVALATAPFAPVFPGGPHKRPAIPRCKRCDQAGARPGSAEYLACAATGRVGHGLYDATTDPERITGWWSPHPDCLVGLRTEGLLVVDLDDRDGQRSGWDVWIELAEPHGWTPLDAPMVGTPSGGVHIYFEQPEGADVRNSAGKLGPGIDVRADGGYCIAPGSRLPDGRCYELLEPFPAVLPVAPGWLVKLAAKPALRSAPDLPRVDATGESAYGLAALDRELGELARAREGTRNNTLNATAFALGQLVAGGELDAHHVHAELLLVARRVGLDEREAEQTIASGMRDGAQQPRQAPRKAS